MNVENFIPIIVTAIITSLCSLGIQVILNKRSRNIEVLKERLVGVYIPFYINSSRYVSTDNDEINMHLLRNIALLLDKLHLLGEKSQAQLIDINWEIELDGPVYIECQLSKDYKDLRISILKEYRSLCKALKYPIPKIKN